MIRVERLESPAAEWDAFVRGQSDWTHFHLSGWKRIIESALGHECIYLAARDERETIVGVLPLVRVKSALFGHYLVSMPFLNYGGPLGTPEAIGALADHARVLGDAATVKLVQLRSRRELPLEWSVSHHKVTSILDLPANSEELWSSFRSKLRTDVKRPFRDGVTVKFGPTKLDEFYRIFAFNMRDLGTPVHSRRLFALILDEFGDSVLLGCAYHDGRAIGGGFGFIWNGEFEMTWSSTLRETRRLRPNMALYWAFMEESIQRGAEKFNFGRSTPDSGTHGFKRKWGTRDEPLHWYFHSPSGVSTAPSPEDDAYSWGPRIWSRLPIRVANALGPHIVRYIP